MDRNCLGDNRPPRNRRIGTAARVACCCDSLSTGAQQAVEHHATVVRSEHDPARDEEISRRLQQDAITRAQRGLHAPPRNGDPDFVSASDEFSHRVERA
jgi:hypothetical protein